MTKKESSGSDVDVAPGAEREDLAEGGEPREKHAKTEDGDLEEKRTVDRDTDDNEPRRKERRDSDYDVDDTRRRRPEPDADSYDGRREYRDRYDDDPRRYRDNTRHSTDDWDRRRSRNDKAKPSADERIYYLEARLAAMEDRMYDMWARVDAGRRQSYYGGDVPRRQYSRSRSQIRYRSVSRPRYRSNSRQRSPSRSPLSRSRSRSASRPPLSPGVGIRRRGTDGHEKAQDSRVHILINRVDPLDGVRRDVPEKEALPQDDYVGKDRPAAVLRKFHTNDNTNSSELHVKDPALQALIEEVLSDWAYHIYLGSQMIIISPFVPLIFNWDLLVDESKKEDSDPKRKQARADLALCLESIRSGSGDEKLDSYFKIREDLKASQTISYDSLWTLFPPGEIVYSQVFGKNTPDNDSIFIVNGFESGWPVDDPGRPAGALNKWTVHCWTYDLNSTGTQFQRKDITLSIEEPRDSARGKKLITQLAVFPISYMEASKRQALLQRLLERGKQYRKICSADSHHKMYEYNGDAIISIPFRRAGRDQDPYGYPYRAPPPSKKKFPTPLIDANVVVDVHAYNRYGPRDTPLGEYILSDDFDECNCDSCIENVARKKKTKPHFDDVPLDLNVEWEDLQYQLCPPRVLGCVLKEMQWSQLAVTKLRAVKPQTYEEAMSRLYLDGRRDGEDKKRLLYGLVQSHGSAIIEDIVPDKGKGLVILLYGVPGTGKSSTAQMIARAAGRPLFSIGVAQVGTDAQQVESNLDVIFSLATRWRAILLIDEADVFLQSRNSNTAVPSPESSALVSVFLRVLEYYQGVLILTTNQIAQFDIATQSRIQLALRYDELGPEQTYNVFMSFIRKLDSQGMVNRNDMDDIEQFVQSELPRKKFDGRQLRNIVISSINYAKSTGRDALSMRDIKHICSYSEDWKLDLAGQMKSYADSIKQARLG